VRQNFELTPLPSLFLVVGVIIHVLSSTLELDSQWHLVSHLFYILSAIMGFLIPFYNVMASLISLLASGLLSFACYNANLISIWTPIVIVSGHIFGIILNIISSSRNETR